MFSRRTFQHCELILQREVKTVGKKGGSIFFFFFFFLEIEKSRRKQAYFMRIEKNGNDNELIQEISFHHVFEPKGN